MSCITISPVNPKEESTAVITLSFLDEDEGVVTPSDLEWQLVDRLGSIVNDLDFASNSFTGTEIVLTGDDLSLSGVDDDGDRYFCVRGIYDSSAGTGLSITGELKFTICNLLNIT